MLRRLRAVPFRIAVFFLPILLFPILWIAGLQAEVNAVAEMLTKAARLGDLKTIENLLSTGTDPDLPDRYGVSSLYYAASLNRTEAVELLLAHHANPNPPVNVSRRKSVDEVPRFPLQYAAAFGNFRMASKLIAGGANVDAQDAKGRTALHFALDHLDIIGLLMEKGAHVNSRDEEGTSPLDNAVWRGSLDAVAILLAHGARLNDIQPKTGATPLNEAAYRGKTPIVRYLLQFDPDLETVDKRGYDPLHNAIRMGKEDTALLLLEAVTEERPKPEFFERALDAAIRKNEALVVKSLLQHGALENGALLSGFTPLDAAASTGAIDVVRCLLENGADPNISGRNGTSPLEDAALQGSEPIASMLLDRGAAVNYVNGGSGTTALYAAASFGKSGVAEMLLKQGANPNLCGRNRRTPYEAALASGYKDLAAQIQKYGGANSCE